MIEFLKYVYTYCLELLQSGWSRWMNLEVSSEGMMVNGVEQQRQDLQRFLGPQLMDAGLLTQAQVQVIYADQDLSGLPFGDIAVSRGWVKEATIHYVARKVALVHQLMATVQELRTAREGLQRELDAFRRKPQAFSQKASRPSAIAQQSAYSSPPGNRDAVGNDDCIDWIG